MAEVLQPAVRAMIDDKARARFILRDLRARRDWHDVIDEDERGSARVVHRAVERDGRSLLTERDAVGRPRRRERSGQECQSFLAHRLAAVDFEAHFCPRWTRIEHHGVEAERRTGRRRRAELLAES